MKPNLPASLVIALAGGAAFYGLTWLLWLLVG